jgi:hypothetical protein
MADVAEKKIIIKVPEIKIETLIFWQELEAKYISKVTIKGDGLHFTETLFYIAHAESRSSLLHSLVSHLAETKTSYAKQNSYEFRLIKAAILEGFFGLRECLAGLINCVFQLGVDCSQIGSTSKVMKEAISRKLAISNSLLQIIPKNSMLDKYLSEFRHPYVHREDLSSFSTADITASIIGAEQPRIIRFIDNSYQTSQTLQTLEEKIAQECSKELGIN